MHAANMPVADINNPTVSIDYDLIVQAMETLSIVEHMLANTRTLNSYMATVHYTYTVW